MTAHDRARRTARRQAHLGAAILAAMLIAAFPLRPLLAPAEPDVVHLRYVPLPLDRPVAP